MEIPRGWYIKKEGICGLTGMSGRVERTAFDQQVECIEETVSTCLMRFPRSEKSGIKKVLSSLSDETPDKNAVIDEPLPGLILATGFSGHGFMHSPAVGPVILDLVQQKEPRLDISEFRLRREYKKEAIGI
jgi:sarcosine oxidase subunit beta